MSRLGANFDHATAIALSVMLGVGGAAVIGVLLVIRNWWRNRK
jgi:hypothetical protein